MAKLAVPPSRELPAAKTNSAAGLGLACVVDATMPSHPEISHDDFLDFLLVLSLSLSHLPEP